MPSEKISSDKIRELLAQGYSVERIKREFGGGKDRIRTIRDQSDLSSSISHGASQPTDNSRKDDQSPVSGSSGSNLSTDRDRPTDHIDEKKLCLSQVVITVPDKQNFQRCLHSGRMNLELKMWLWKNSRVE